MAKTDDKHPKKLTQQERHDVALDVLRHARWVTDELPETDMKERVEKIGPWLTDEFAFYDEYVVSTGSGIRITERGRLYMRMVDGL